MTPDQLHFESMLEGISRGSTADIKVLHASLRPSEIAGVLEANLPETRQIIWGWLDEDVRNQSLQYLHDDVRGQFLETMDTAQLGRGNLLWMLNREFIVADLNGLLWASVVALGAVYFFDDPQLGWVIAVAMIATILIGAIAGSLLPTLLRRMNIDPAIAGGVVLTTITDVAGFFIFLGLASWVYL